MQKANLIFRTALVLVEVIGMMISLQGIAQSIGTGEEPQNSNNNNLRRAEIHINNEVDGQTIIIDTTILIDDNLEISDILDRLGLLNSNTEGNSKKIAPIYPFVAPNERPHNDNFEMGVPAPSPCPIENCRPRAFMGVYVRNMHTQNSEKDSDNDISGEDGVYIDELAKNGAAEKAGLEKGDYIRAIDGKKIANYAVLREVIAQYKPGDAIKVEYRRKNADKHTKLILGNAMQPSNMMVDCKTNCQEICCNRASLGIICDAAYEQGGHEGILINRIMPGSAAENAGLERGDILLKIDNEAVNKADELRKIISAHKIGDKVFVTYTRNGQKQSINVELQKNMLPDMPYMRRNFFQLPSPQIQYFDTPQDTEKLNGVDWEQPLSDKMYDAMSSKRFKVAILIVDLNNDEARQLNKGSDSDHKWSENNTLPAEELSFFPNPNNGKFMVKFQLPQKEKVTVTISDLYGREVFKDEVDNFGGLYERQIDLSQNAKGTYFLQIMQDGKQLGKKIIIQ